MPTDYDVIVIGAGPSGAISSALLVSKGYKVLVLEREVFPRFSIGESLLPQCMTYIEEAGMLDAVLAADFQLKDGACFSHKGNVTAFDFNDKFSEGPGTTFQVERAKFDKVLADEAENQGVEIRYQHEIIAVDTAKDLSTVTFKATTRHETQTLTAKFILDASGFGRVLPRLLDLSLPSDFPVRQSVFTHIHDNISAEASLNCNFDRNKILLTVHPKHKDVWLWLIPLSSTTCSIGVVAKTEFFDDYPEDGIALLKEVINEEKNLSEILKNADFFMQTRKITGYSANVKSLYGDGFALLGNAGEFLDPIFSSGVTIAMCSASMAANLLDKQLAGETVDWQTEYSEPLKQGIDAFKTYVEGWYDGDFQDVVFHQEQLVSIKAMVCSILAGYAWDTTNPYVKNGKRRLAVLAEICRLDAAEANTKI